MGAVIIVEYPLYAKYMIIINDKIKPNMLNIAVPFFIYNPEESAKGVDKFTEDSCSGTGLYIPHGYNLLDKVIVR